MVATLYRPDRPVPPHSDSSAPDTWYGCATWSYCSSCDDCTTDDPSPSNANYTGSTTVHFGTGAFLFTTPSFAPRLTLPPQPFIEPPPLHPFVLINPPRRFSLRLMPAHSGRRWGRVKKKA